jgi:hypothetical protein
MEEEHPAGRALEGSYLQRLYEKLLPKMPLASRVAMAQIVVWKGKRCMGELIGRMAHELAHGTSDKASPISYSRYLEIALPLERVLLG